MSANHLLTALMLLEAQHPGSQVEKAVALKFTAEEWPQIIEWLALVSLISRQNLSMNQFLRLALLLQGSGEETEALVAVEGVRRTRGSLTAPPQRVGLRMPASIGLHLKQLCQRTGGTNSQVVYACAERLAQQLKAVATARELNVRRRRSPRRDSSGT